MTTTIRPITQERIPSRATEHAGRLTGRILKRCLQQDPEHEYFLYLPQTRLVEAPMFVSVHGITRNAAEHARSFAPFAERNGVILIAPLFSTDRFPGYQRLARTDKGPRADLTLDHIVAEVGDLVGSDIDRLFMFGYSGGGQFVHRYALAHPLKVARLVVAAAGWYTFPDPTRSYPSGLKGTRDMPVDGQKTLHFLSIPISVLVGDGDTLRDPELNKSRRIDGQQGLNRLERGRRWIRSMEVAARAYQLHTEYRFEELPTSDHSFTNCMTRGGMGERVFEFLFDSSVNRREGNDNQTDA